MSARVHIKLAEEFPENERRTLPGRGGSRTCLSITTRIAILSATKAAIVPEGCPVLYVATTIALPATVQRPTGCSATRLRDLFVFGYNVRDKARVGTCDPVPPKLQEYERRRVEPEARSGAERKQQQEPTQLPRTPAIRKSRRRPYRCCERSESAPESGATTSATTAPAARMMPLIASLAALSPPRMTAT